MKITSIIWDIGGVLERTEDAGPRSEAAASVGISVEQLSDLIFGNTTEHRVQLGEISLEEHHAYVQRELKLPSTAALQHLLEQFFAGDQLDLELVRLIRELKRRYTTAVLSNYVSILREKITTTWAIADAFDHLVISSEVGHKKPAPEIYQIALETIGCQPEEAVFIDDFIENIDGAQLLGIHGIHFINPEQAISDLTSLLAG